MPSFTTTVYSSNSFNSDHSNINKSNAKLNHDHYTSPILSIRYQYTLQSPYRIAFLILYDIYLYHRLLNTMIFSSPWLIVKAI